MLCREMALEACRIRATNFSPHKKHNAMGGFQFVEVKPIKTYSSKNCQKIAGCLFAFFGTSICLELSRWQ